MAQRFAVDRRFPEQLARRLAEPLPGRAVQRELEPELSHGRHYAPPPSTARAAAVLALLYPKDDQWHVPLTVRPESMVDHGGQVSFPGGMIEAGETSQQAALRELSEELGVASDAVELLGKLSPTYLYVSNFAITPWVGVVDRLPEMHSSPAEVDEVLEVPLAHLLDPANVGQQTHNHRGIRFYAPHYAWGEHRIWGATSMMLAELVAIVGELADSVTTS